MKIYILFILVVGSSGKYWKNVNDIKDTISGFHSAADITIKSIEVTINITKREAADFVKNFYRNNPVISYVTESQQSTKDNCSRHFVNKDNLNSSFIIQAFQLEVPLHERIIDIKERLSTINSTANLYQKLADSKFMSCQSIDGCEERTKDWLESMIRSLSCKIYPNCSRHSIKKRSPCSPGQFKCSSGSCLESYYFCDGSCHCGHSSGRCSDEPPGCVKNCHEFRCKETFKCIPKISKCDGKDDCGDGSDEEGCEPVYTHVNCSMDTGNFLCNTKKCIGIELVCDGYDDCGDDSDEGGRCGENVCSPPCSRIEGGVCLVGPRGPRCLYECPPGTFESSVCSPHPGPSPNTLAEVIDDTPRLTARYATRFKYLKMKTIAELSKSIQELVRCKNEEYVLLSKIIQFSSKIPWNITASPSPALKRNSKRSP